MARPLRIEYPGAFYHVMSHGNGKQWIYKIPEDFLNFIEILSSIKKKYRIIYHSIQLMRNHYHLVLETPLGNLSKGMLYLNREYSRLYNKKYNRKGSVFKQRYKSILIEKEEYYSNVIRYTNQNCIRAGICKKVESYPGGIWYHILNKTNSYESKIIQSIMDIEMINNLLGFNNIKDLLLWLNDELESDISLENKYKYIWGSRLWIDEIKSKYIDATALSEEIIEKDKLQKSYSGIWQRYKVLDEYKNHSDYKNILIYFLSNYSGLTQFEISLKVGLSSSRSVSQRLYRFHHRMNRDNELKKIIERIENVNR